MCFRLSVFDRFWGGDAPSCRWAGPCIGRQSTSAGSEEVGGFLGGLAFGEKGAAIGVRTALLVIGGTALAPAIVTMGVFVVGGVLGGVVGSTAGKAEANFLYELDENAAEVVRTWMRNFSDKLAP